MIRALAFALTLSPLASAEAPRFEVRDAQLVSDESNYVRLPLGPAGIDLRAQMDRFHANFTDALEPKTPGPLTMRQLLDVAGATALDPAARAELERSFQKLKLTDLSVRLSPPPAAPDQKPTGETSPVEISFFATLAWTDAKGASGVTSLRGHLAAANDVQINANQAPADLNVTLSPLINVDKITYGGITADQVKMIIGPAVMGNLILAILTPVDQLKGSELESIGRALQDGSPTQF